MTIPWYILPPDAATNSAEAHHDTAGWTLTARRMVRPGTTDQWLVFDVPDGTPDQNGCWLTISGGDGKPLYQLHGVLYLHLSTVGMVIDIFPMPPKQTVMLPRLVANEQFLAQE